MLRVAGLTLRRMLAIVVNFTIHPEKEEEAIAALEANAAGSRQEPGCLKWEWCRHVDEPNRFAIYELYEDKAAIQRHRAAAHFQDWRASAPNFMAEKTSGVYEVTGVDTRPVGG